jgi:hypothetical protein
VIASEVPAGVVGAAATDGDAGPPRTELGDPLQGAGEVGLDAEDPDERLHDRLEVPLDGVGILALGAFERHGQLADGVRDLDGIHVRRVGQRRRVSGGARSGASTEDQEIGQRVAAQAVRAVHAAGDLPRGEEARHRRGARLRVDPDATHDVVGRRPDLHRALRDVDVGELLELVVHRWQLAADVLGRQVADVEVDAAVGRAAALLDLRVDRPRDVVPG